jgi:hypothetical protein
MSHPVRFLVVGGLLVMSGACSDTAPTAPALEANPRISAIGKPTRSPLPTGEDFEIPAGVVCSFGVFVETIVNNQVVKTFPPEPNGDIVQLATGNFVTRMTNTSTSKSITINISGPGRFTLHPDGSFTLEATGRWFLGLIENAPFTAFISSGRVVISFAPDGTGTLVSQSGHVEDICALLS